MNYIKFNINYKGVTIRVSYCPDFLNCRYVAHFEFKSAYTMPFSKTGYRSVFIKALNLSTEEAIKLAYKILIDSSNARFKPVLIKKDSGQFSLF